MKKIIAIAAMFVAGAAFADDITVDTTPFVSSKTRAEVRVEAVAAAKANKDAYKASNPVFVSTKTRAEVKAETAEWIKAGKPGSVLN